MDKLWKLFGVTREVNGLGEFEYSLTNAYISIDAEITLALIWAMAATVLFSILLLAFCFSTSIISLIGLMLYIIALVGLTPIYANIINGFTSCHKSIC
jgi:hypothetical protein